MHEFLLIILTVADYMIGLVDVVWLCMLYNTW